MSKTLTGIAMLRKKIDETDKRILKALAERFMLTRKVGAYKAKHNLPPQDKKREQEIFTHLEKFAKKLNLDVSLVKKTYRLIMKTARAEHKKFK